MAADAPPPPPTPIDGWRRIDEFRAFGNVDGEYGGTGCLAVGRTNHKVYVTARRLQALLIFEPSAFSATSAPAFEAHEAWFFHDSDLRGLAVTRSNEVIVADAQAASVKVLSPQGRLLRTLEGQFDQPESLALSDDETWVYVADAQGVQAFHWPDGRWSHQWPLPEPDAFHHPPSLALTPTGHLAVAQHQCIHLYSPDGELCRTLHTSAPIRNLAITPEHEYVVVTTTAQLLGLSPQGERIYTVEGEAEAKDHGDRTNNSLLQASLWSEDEGSSQETGRWHGLAVWPDIIAATTTLLVARGGMIQIWSRPAIQH